MYHANVNVNLVVENVIQLKSGIMTNVDTRAKTSYIWKYYIWNPATRSCENDKYLASVIYDLLITCDEIIEETKTVPGNFNEKK